MKIFVIYTLLFTILLQAVGCMSFYPLDKNESIKDYLKPENRLAFKLKNGDYIKASSNVCVFIDKPGNYIFGVGTLLNVKTKDDEAFQGEVNMESVDSVINIIFDSKKYVSCWLKDSKKILFEENDVVIITPETAPDFWVINDHHPKIINSKDINEIQVEKLNTSKSIIFGVS